MSDRIRFIASGLRIMGAYKVCTSCGAQVDNEFIAEHVAFHQAATP